MRAMRCNLFIEDFRAMPNLRDPITGLCLTPRCQYQHVGRHPRRPGICVCHQYYCSNLTKSRVVFIYSVLVLMSSRGSSRYFHMLRIEQCSTYC